MHTIVQGYGSCLCGQVKLFAPKLSTHLGACHCSMCRKWGGGPFMSLEGGPDIQWQHEDAIHVFNSSAWAERGFCKHCGTHLFYRLKASNDYFFPIGLFEDIPEFDFTTQIYIDKKPAYYDFANQTQMLTEDDVTAMVANMQKT